MVSLVVAAVLVALGVLASGRSVWIAIVPGLLSGMVTVDKFVRFRGNMISNRFMKQLPDAIDTVIRGIRSGLPVIECIGSVGQEYDDPVGGHFKAISERVQLGEPLEGALWKVAQVIEKPEMDFLAIAIAIQVETGGSLSDALGNLADLLRARERMKLKIKAISSEAKASALIIGALPFVMLGLLMMMSPDYVMPLFTDPRGQMMLARRARQHQHGRLRHVADDPVRDLGDADVPLPAPRLRHLGGALGPAAARRREPLADREARADGPRPRRDRAAVGPRSSPRARARRRRTSTCSRARSR